MERHSLGRQAHLLLVEDNEDDIEQTLEAFRDSKVRVDIDVVRDGTQALAFLRRQPPYEQAARPDLVLLDLNLPKLDGRGVLSAIKADPQLQRIPIVVLTISQDEADVHRVYDLHANSYVVKPLDFSRFMDVIRSIEGFWLTVVKLPGS